jgi:pimeloyl-ACP methyl ester carboxylesterase
VLLGAPLRLGDKPRIREAWKTTFSKLSDPIDPQFLGEFLDSIVVHPQPQPLRDGLVGESLKTPAFVWKETMAGLLDDDPSAELAHLAAPTLVLWGDRDRVLPCEEQEELASRIPKARLGVYEGGGHAFYWEDPARVAADVAAFARSLATR